MTPTKQDPIESICASLIYHKAPAALSQRKDMLKTSDLSEQDLFDGKFLFRVVAAADSVNTCEKWSYDYP